MFPSAVVHVILTIFIFKYKLINRLCAMDNVINQWLSQQIFVWTFWLVGNGYANSANFAFMNIIRCKEKIVFTIFFDNTRRPHGLLRPFHFRCVDNRRMPFPIHYIVGRKSVEKYLLFVWCGGS